MSEPLLRPTLPERPTSPGVPNELLSRWLSALQLEDTKSFDALTYPYDLTQTPRYYQDAAITGPSLPLSRLVRGCVHDVSCLPWQPGRAKRRSPFRSYGS